MRIPWKLRIYWARLWMIFAGRSLFGRLAAHLATWFTPPYHGRYQLRYMNRIGFIAPSVRIWHSDLTMGTQVFMGDRVIIYRNEGGGPVIFGEHVGLGHDVVIETGQGGSIRIGDRSRCQFSCHLAAYKSPIIIGRNVGIGQGCAFFSHDHGRSPEEHGQLVTKGPIVVEDDAWLGAGVKVLSGVRIGKGAVVAAGSVVTRDVPDGAVAAGSPARVIKSERKGNSREMRLQVPEIL